MSNCRNNENWKRSIIKNSKSSILRKLKRIEEYDIDPNYCECCKLSLCYDKRHNKFCNHTCAAYYNNLKNKKPKKVAYCLNCLCIIENKKFCNTECLKEFNYKNDVKTWLNAPGDIKSPRSYMKKWLIEKNGNCCHICGWAKQHPISENIPIEMHHKDGNWKNNIPDNLIILCPNCHSLTHNFRFYNKGNGRPDSRLKK